MIRVIVNDVSLDLKSGAVIALSKKSADIGTLQNRFSSFTNKFQVKNTKKNRDALGLKQYQDYSGTQYTELNGKLTSNGLEIASNVAVIIESVAEDITLTIRAGNGNLFDRLNRTKLSDIDFTYYNHYWNITEILDATSNDWQNVYVYPLHNTGNQSLITKTAQAKGLIPFVFVKSLYALIGEMFGYAWTGSTYSMQAFEYLMMAIARLNISQEFAETLKFSGAAIPYTFNQGTVADRFYPRFTGLLDQWNLVLDTLDPDELFLGQLYFVPLPGRYALTFDYDLTVESKGISLGNHKVSIFRSLDGPNGVELFETSADISPGSLNTPTNFTGTVTMEFSFDNIFDDIPVGLGAQYSLTCWVEIIIDVPNIAYADITVNSGTFKVDQVSIEKTHYNRPLSLGDHLPDWTLGKFIKEVGNIFGAIYDVDEFRKEIEITRLDEIAANRDEALDWSDKLDLSVQPEITYIIDGIARTTIWQWSDLLRYVYRATVNNDQLPDQSEYVKSDSVYTDTEFVCQQSLPVSSFQVWDIDNNRINMDNKARFAFYRIDIEELYIADLRQLPGSETIHPAAYFDYQNSPNSLDWSRLYSSYYQQLFDPMVFQMNKIVANFKLSDLDIQSFRFKYPVFIKYFNRFFYVNEISEFTGSDQSTRCTLIAI